MKKRALSILAIVSLLSAGEYVTPLSTTALYESSEGKKEITTLKSGETLDLLSKEKKFFQVKTADGTTGWVRKKEVTTKSSSVQDTFAVDTVMYDDNGMSPGHVDGVDDAPVTDALIPERSFKNALKNNIDKENAPK